MTAALEGGEWSAARPGRTLTPGKNRYLLYRRLGGPQGRSGRTENLVPTGIRSRTVQLVVSRYTDWATRPTYTYKYIYIHTHTYIYVYIYTYTHTHTYVFTHTYTYIYCIYIYILYVCYFYRPKVLLWLFLLRPPPGDVGKSALNYFPRGWFVCPVSPLPYNYQTVKQPSSLQFSGEICWNPSLAICNLRSE